MRRFKMESYYGVVTSDGLCHYGVKGMKWGARKSSSTGATKKTNLATKVKTTAKRGVGSVKKRDITGALYQHTRDKYYKKEKKYKDSMDLYDNSAKNTTGVKKAVYKTFATANRHQYKMAKNRRQAAEKVSNANKAQVDVLKKVIKTKSVTKQDAKKYVDAVKTDFINQNKYGALRMKDYAVGLVKSVAGAAVASIAVNGAFDLAGIKRS